MARTYPAILLSIVQERLGPQAFSSMRSLTSRANWDRYTWMLLPGSKVLHPCSAPIKKDSNTIVALTDLKDLQHQDLAMGRSQLREKHLFRLISGNECWVAVLHEQFAIRPALAPAKDLFCKRLASCWYS